MKSKIKKLTEYTFEYVALLNQQINELFNSLTWIENEKD